MTEEEKFLVCKNTLANEIKGMVGQGTKNAGLALNLIDALNKELRTLEDVIIFCITMKYVVAELWHIITYDKDLSDDKIVRLGEQGQIFYLMDNSEIYQKCVKHVGMKNMMFN